MNQLPNNQIDVWKIEIPKHYSEENNLLSLLSENEKMRASKFATSALASRYIISQGILRRILANYLSINPEAISYTFGTYKKPYLEDKTSNIQFNLSHSGDMALVAISSEDEVGVDIEIINEKALEKNLAPSILSPNEFTAFQRMQKMQQIEAFFSAWTHKEALLKLMGVGLYKEMKELEVPLNIASIPHLVLFEEKKCYIQSFFITKKYIGAIASSKQDFYLRFLTFERHC